MGMRTGKLTAVTVGALARSTGARSYHGDGGGLWLQVTPGGASWVFRYRVNGRLREMGLGSLATIGLADARDKARKARQQRLDGLDPIEERKASRLAARLADAKAMTFRQCAEAYIAANRAGWRNPKHAAQWPATLGSYVYPIMGEMPVQAVDTGLVMKAIEPIWNVKPETASRVRGRIETVLDWAKARGYRDGENPARWKGPIENLLPARSKVRRVEHHPALPYGELPAFMAELREQEGVGASALEFAILTAARTGEAIGATWAEIDLEGRLWIVPAERMKKAGKEHHVPLSEAALAVLRGMAAIREGEHVFPGGRAGRLISNMAMLMLLRRMGRSDLTAHGFRSSFSDWSAECTNFPAEVREMALAHAVGDRVEAAYRRGDLFDKRRQLAEAWARFCDGADGENIVPMRASR